MAIRRSFLFLSSVAIGALKESAARYIQKTVSGCACKSACVSTSFDKHTCDWCYITDSPCKVLFSDWDYCSYDLDDSYEEQTSNAKLNLLWSKVTANESIGGAYPATGGFATMNQSEIEVVENKRDVMPAERVKLRHSIGAVCKMQWNIDNASPYSGLFAPGAKDGLIRLSTQMGVDPAKGIIPGIAFKFTRTGLPSGGVVGLSSTEAQYWNYFKHNMSNHLLPPAEAPPKDPKMVEELKELSEHFWTASQCSHQVGLSDMARWGQDGAEVTKVAFPFKLFFVPTSEAQLPDVPKTLDEILSEMRAFPLGTPLFMVYACGAPGKGELHPTSGGLEVACAQPTKLGPMTITSECVPSAFGDNELNMIHQRIEEDWQLRPEWLNQYDVAAACERATKPTPDSTPRFCGASLQQEATMRADDTFVV